MNPGIEACGALEFSIGAAFLSWDERKSEYRVLHKRVVRCRGALVNSNLRRLCEFV